MIETSQEITELVKAINQVQGELHGVAKDGRNPHFKNKYATLENVISTARDPLTRAGIVFTQAPGQIIDGAVEITTQLSHTSGQWMRSTLHMPLAKRDPQGTGSAITYGCRYSLMAMLGLPPVDDDAEAATIRKPLSEEPIEISSPPGKYSIGVSSGNGRISSAEAKRRNVWEDMTNEIAACKTIEDLKEWESVRHDDIGVLPPQWVEQLREKWADRYKELKTGK